MYSLLQEDINIYNGEKEIAFYDIPKTVISIQNFLDGRLHMRLYIKKDSLESSSLIKGAADS